MTNHAASNIDFERAFEALGVDDPSSWARPQIDEGKPQPARAVSC